MAINLTIVCSERPDAEACIRLGKAILQPPAGRVPFDGINIFEVPVDHHEFESNHVLVLEATDREAAVYLEMYVLASITASGFDGFLIDEAKFFPRLELSALLKQVICDSRGDLASVWHALKETLDR